MAQSHSTTWTYAHGCTIFLNSKRENTLPFLMPSSTYYCIGMASLHITYPTSIFFFRSYLSLSLSSQQHSLRHIKKAHTTRGISPHRPVPPPPIQNIYYSSHRCISPFPPPPRIIHHTCVVSLPTLLTFTSFTTTARRNIKCVCFFLYILSRKKSYIYTSLPHAQKHLPASSPITIPQCYTIYLHHHLSASYP